MKKIVVFALVIFFSTAVPLLGMDKKSQKRKFKSIDFVDNVDIQEIDGESDDYELTIIELAKGILDSSHIQSDTNFKIIRHGIVLSVQFKNDIALKVLSISTDKPRKFFLKAERIFSLECLNPFNSRSIVKDSNFKNLYKIFSHHTSGLMPVIDFKEKNDNYTDTVVVDPGKDKGKLSYFG